MGIYLVRSIDGYSFEVVRDNSEKGGFKVVQRDGGVCINVWREPDFASAKHLANYLAK